MPCPSQYSWLDHPNDIWWEVQSINYTPSSAPITSNATTIYCYAVKPIKKLKLFILDIY
jgi:hypothetical protein